MQPQPATSLADTFLGSGLLRPVVQPNKGSSCTAITLNFRELGGYDGSMGVNNYGGALVFGGNNISIRGLIQTPDMDPLGISYLTVLNQAQTVEYSPGKLIIHCQAGEELAFRPV
jgi:heat shock protein HslJ